MEQRSQEFEEGGFLEDPRDALLEDPRGVLPLVPKSMYEVVAWSENADIADNLPSFSGPALAWAVRSTILTIILWVLTPIWAYAVFVYTPDRYSSMILYPPLILLVFGLLYLEERTFRFAIIPLATNLMESFTVIVISVSFWPWFLYVKMSSCAAHADIVTSGVFIARTVQETTSNPKINSIWNWTMRNSLARHLVMSFEILPCVGWLLMSIQGIYCFLFVVPRQEQIKWSIGYQRWETYSGTRVDNGQALMVLADLNRMASLTSLESNYRQRQALTNRAGSEGMAESQLRRNVIKFVAFCVFEGAYNLNVQSAGLAIQKAASLDHKIEVETLVSIILGSAMAMQNLYGACSTLAWYRALKSDQLVWYQDAKRPIALFTCSMFLYALLILRAIFQTFMAVFICEDGLHNIGVGCVEIPSDLKL